MLGAKAESFAPQAQALSGVADKKVKENFTFPILWIGKIWYNRIGKGKKKEVTKMGSKCRRLFAKIWQKYGLLPREYPL